MPYWPFILTGLVGFLAGSIPTGWLVARVFKVDIQTAGSGNIGATNVFRVLGTGPGLFVLIVDALKGVVSAALVPEMVLSWFLAKDQPRDVIYVWLPYLGGVASVLGHNFTPWLKFKGGKGIATSGGVIATLMPIAFAAALIMWLVAYAFTGYASLGSIAAAMALPIAAYFAYSDPRVFWFALVLGLLAIYKHRSNIRRLLKGTEPKLGRHVSADPDRRP